MFNTPLPDCFSIPTHHLLLIYPDQWRRDSAVQGPLLYSRGGTFPGIYLTVWKMWTLPIGLSSSCVLIQSRSDDVSAMGLEGTSTIALLDYNSLHPEMALVAEGHAQ